MDFPVHTREFIEENLLPQALEFVRAGEQRLQAQRARVENLNPDNASSKESRKLLDIMETTLKLQRDHVSMLQRELQTPLAYPQEE